MAAAAGLPNAAAAAAASGGGGAAGGAGAAPIPYFVIKDREYTTSSSGPIYYKGVSVGREAAAIAAFMDRFVYFDLRSKAESGSTSDSIRTAAAGTLYTWIIKQLVDGNKILIAARTRGAQEIGTLHKNLEKFTDSKIPGEVISAGELIRTPTGITYNLFSGSFMEPIFRPSTSKSAEARKIEKRAVAIASPAEMFGAMFPAAAIPTDEQLIVPAALPPTSNANISFYNSFLNRNVSRTKSRTENGAAASAVRGSLFGGARRSRRVRRKNHRRKSRHAQ